MKKQIASPNRAAKRIGRVSRRTGVSRRVLLPCRSRSASLKASVPAPTGKVEARLTGNDVVLSLDGKPQGIARHRSRRTRTLLSFQGPMPVRAGNEKASADARGLRFDGLRKRSYPNRAKDSSSQGLSNASLAGGRRSVPERVLVSTRRDEPGEATLPRLQDLALEGGRSVVEPVDRDPVELHAALGDQPSRVARREPEGRRDDGRQVNRIARRQGVLRHLVRALRLRARPG